MKKTIISIFVLALLFSCNRDPQNLIKIEGKLLPVNETYASDSSIVKMIAPYKKKIEKEMNTVLTYTPKDLNRTDGNMESSLGNLLADMSYERSNPVFLSRTSKNIDFAFFNYGGIRSGISKGPVTYENAFKLMPFENSFVVVELTYEKLMELAEYLIQSKRAHPISSHIKLTIKENSFDLKIDGKSPNESETFFVLTTDYLQHGGDNMLFFSNPKSLVNLDYKMRNGIIDYFEETDTLRAAPDGRIIIEN